MISFTPTNGLGAVLRGDTPHGVFRVEWDADGKLVSEHIEIRDPATYTTPPPPATRPSASKAATPAKPDAKRCGFTPRISPPGTWLAAVIHAVTLGTARYGRGCKSRAAKLNVIGWRGLPKYLVITMIKRVLT